jgi:hypothetical protein
MLPHTGSTFLDINPNQTSPNDPKKKNKGKKITERKKRECLAMKKNFALSLDLSHGIQ